VILDLGTGDGRAVLERAAAEPDALVIGMDAASTAMAEASRRADRGGVANALFLTAAAETLATTTALARRVDLVTVTLPWGSLLRGALGLDDGTVLTGIAAVLRAGGRLEVIASVVPADHVPGLDALDGGARDGLRDAWQAAGLRLETMEPVTSEALRATGSIWGRRLAAGGSGRAVWRLAGSRA